MIKREENNSMRLLKYGDVGPLVELLQTALSRAGFSPGVIDGIYGTRTQNAVRAFQVSVGLTADGVAGPQTNRALLPYYLGYAIHTVRSRDTLYRIAMAYDTTIRAIEIANPGSIQWH
jgi:g-D-glutamyl-meso-diaminopimelate peptidase